MFVHHINKDPKKGFGKPVFSTIDNPMKRVIVISEISLSDAKNKGAKKFLDMISNGIMPEVSMGCKVPFDICSICGNKAKSPAFYCKHLSGGNMLQMDQETGKVAYAINDFPRFFDLSFVNRGADRSSGTLMKIAGDTSIISEPTKIFIPSGYRTIIDEKIAEEKESLINESEIKDTEEFLKLSRDINDVGEMEDLLLKRRTDAFFPTMDRGTLNKLANESMGDVFGTFWSFGLPLKRSEIQYIGLNKMGHPKLANELYERGALLPIVNNAKNIEEIPLGVSDNAIKIAKAIFCERTMKQPFLLKRMVNGPVEKVAVEISDSDAMGISIAMTAIYAALAKLVKKTDVPALAKILNSNPKLLAAIGLANFTAAKMAPTIMMPTITRKDQTYVRPDLSLYKRGEEAPLVDGAIDRLKGKVRGVIGKILGNKKDLAATALLASGFLGIREALKNKKEVLNRIKGAHPKNRDNMSALSNSIIDHPVISTAAAATIGNVFFRKGKKALFSKKSSENVLDFDIIVNEGTNGIDELNSCTNFLLQ